MLHQKVVCRVRGTCSDLAPPSAGAAPRALCRAPCSTGPSSARRTAGRCAAQPSSQPTPPAHVEPAAEPLRARGGDASTSDSTNWSLPQGPTLAAALVAAMGTAALCLPEASGAAEVLTGQPLELFTQLLEYIEDLGPWGWLLYVSVLTVCESVPLLPTLPLSLSGGLLFGAQKGAALVLLGGTLAALNAFYISRGIGGPLVKKLIGSEMLAGKVGTEQANGAAAKIAEVQDVIATGGFWRQYWAILLLRMTPIVPFSASNYFLGLTPVQPLAFLMGTVTGCAFWSAAYASLGGASRSLLKAGGDPAVLLADLAEKASLYSHTAGVLALSSGVVAGVLVGGSALLKSSRGEDGTAATVSAGGEGGGAAEQHAAMDGSVGEALPEQEAQAKQDREREAALRR